jgi:hypothetical protein
VVDKIKNPHGKKREMTTTNILTGASGEFYTYLLANTAAVSKGTLPKHGILPYVLADISPGD